MTDKTEWEVVDEPPRDQPPPMADLLKNLLGAWWRWKIAGVAIAGAVVLLLLATLSGIFILLMLSGAALSVGIGKLRQWIGRDQRYATKDVADVFGSRGSASRK